MTTPCRERFAGRFAWLLVAVALVLTAGCGETERIPGQQSRIALSVHTPPFQDAFDRVSTLRISLLVPDDEDLVTTVDISATEFSLEGSPGQGLVLRLEGIGVDGEEVISSGQSDPFDLVTDEPAQVEVLFARRGEFTRLLGDLGVARFGHSVAPLSDTRVLVFGGASGGDPEAPEDFAPPEVYDLIGQKSCLFEESLCPSFPDSDRRVGHTATASVGGKVLVFGGEDPQGDLVDSVLLYDDAQAQFREMTNFDPEQVESRIHHAAEALRFDDGTGKGLRDVVLIVGGEVHGANGRVITGNGLVFDVQAEIFTRTDLSLVHPRKNSTLTPFGAESSLALVAGGEGPQGLVDAGELFDGLDFSAVDAVGVQARTGLLSPRLRHAAVPVEDGVLVVGGDNLVQSMVEPELFLLGTDLGTGFFELGVAGTPSGHSSRRGLIATSLTSGEVLVAGGEAYDGFTGTLLDTSERIQIDRTILKATFLSSEPIGIPLAFAPAARLPSGALLIAGGWREDGGEPVPSSEVWYYNP